MADSDSSDSSVSFGDWRLLMTETDSGFSAGVSSPLNSKILKFLIHNKADLGTYLADSSMATFSLTGVTSGDSDSS